MDSVIIDNFDFFGVGSAPRETDAPLFVNANTVLALAVPLQRLQAIARRKPEELKFHGGVDQLELHERSLLNISRQPPRTGALPELFSLCACEAFDHVGKGYADANYTSSVIIR